MPQQSLTRLFSIYLTFQQILIKGWEVSILLILPLLQVSNQISLAELGILSVTFSVAQTLSSLVSGVLLHKIGSRKIILFSLLAFLIAWLLLLTNPPFILMLAIFFLGGASSGLFETAGIALVSKSFSPGKRANGIANLGMAGDLGRIFFTGITTFLIGSNNLTLLLIIDVVLALILLISFVIIRKHFPLHQTQNTEQIKPQKTAFKYYLSNRNYCLALLAGTMDSFASASLFIFLPLLFVTKGFQIEETGFLSILLFVGYLAGRKILGKLADSKGAVFSLILGEIFMALVIFLILLINNFYVLLGLMVLLGVATRGTSPVAKALLADYTPDDLILENGVAIYQSGSRLANILSRSLFTAITAAWGIGSVFIISAVSALLVAIPAKLLPHKN